MRSINLLPPEAAERGKARRRAAGVVLVALVYLGLLGVAGLWQLGKAADAEQRLADQEAANNELRRQIAALEPAERLRRSYQDGLEDIQVVLARDIAWGSLLTDLGRQLPDRTWLTAFQAQSVLDEATPARFGDLQVTGVAFDYPDTAAFLRAFEGEAWPAVGGAWVPTAQEGSIGEVPVVNFSGVASLTVESLSNRIERLPEVPE